MRGSIRPVGVNVHSSDFREWSFFFQGALGHWDRGGKKDGWLLPTAHFILSCHMSSLVSIIFLPESLLFLFHYVVLYSLSANKSRPQH